MTIDKFITQSDPHTCAVAVIRMIRDNYEKKDISDNDVLNDFTQDVAIRGPNVGEIGQYWEKYKTVYEYQKSNNISLSDIKAKSNNGYEAMIILNSHESTFHCVLFKNFVEGKISYWDPAPNLGHQTETESEFNKKRKQGEGLLEVHFVKKK
jgi:hypothetical protein